MKKTLSLWHKIFLGFIIIALLIILITGYLAIRLFHIGVEQQAEVSVNKDLNSTSRRFYERIESIFINLDDVSRRTYSKNTIINEDTILLKEYLQEIKNQRNLSFFVLIDPSGVIIASANDGSIVGENVKDYTFINSSLRGDEQKGVMVLDESFLIKDGLAQKAFIEIVPTSDAVRTEITEERRGLALAASVPVYDDNNEIIAVLLGGELLNGDFKFVDEITELLNVTATVFLNDLRIATSVRLKNGERALGTKVSKEVADIVLDQGKRYLGRAFIIDEWYLTAYDPIINNTGEVVGMLYVGIPEAPFAVMKKDIVQKFILIATFAIILAVMIAYVITRTITNPLKKLIDAMQKVSLGDLSQRYSKKGRGNFKDEEDEIQQIGNLFNKMMGSLQTNWKKNLDLQKQLEEKEIMRIHLLQKIIVSQEEERKRIARELHDETSQSLTSLMLGLKLIHQSDNLEEVKSLSSNLREVLYNTLEEIQWLSYELRPRALDDLGLSAALKRYVEELSRHAEMDIAYDMDGCKDIRLSPIIETTVYRVVQEALTNITRHASAQKVKVFLACTDRNMLAIIEDDGKGFDLNAIQKEQQSLGLFGMNERATLVGGKLSIDTAPGKGTKITLVIPPLEAELKYQEKLA